jgi:hypothetical protein
MRWNPSDGLEGGGPEGGGFERGWSGGALEFYMMVAVVMLLGIVALGLVFSLGGIKAFGAMLATAIVLFAVTRLVDWLHDRGWRAGG